MRSDDEMVISADYATPASGIDGSADQVRTHTDWLIARANLCDEHLPEMPEAVRKDMAHEREKRFQETQVYLSNRNHFSVPYHRPNLRWVEHPPIVSTLETKGLTHEPPLEENEGGGFL